MSLNEHQKKHFGELVRTVQMYCKEQQCYECRYLDKKTGGCFINEPTKWRIYKDTVKEEKIEQRRVNSRRDTKGQGRDGKFVMWLRSLIHFFFG